MQLSPWHGAPTSGPRLARAASDQRHTSKLKFCWISQAYVLLSCNKTLPKRPLRIGAAMMRRWLLLCYMTKAQADLVFDPSVERVIVNVGSNTQPSLSHDPQTVAIAVEPMVGLSLIHI